MRLEHFWPEITALRIFKGLGPDKVRELLGGACVVTHEHGHSLFRCGTSALFFGYVLSGTYKLSLDSAEGDEVIMHFGVRDEALGIMATMEGNTCFPFNATAMGESRFLQIPKANFTEKWIHTAAVVLRFQSDLQGRIFRSHDEKRISRLPLAERIAHLLIYLAEDKTGSMNKIEVPITRREIAAYVGTTVESVIRVMSFWSRQGLVETTDRQIKIICREALERLASRVSHNASRSQRIESELLSTLWRRTAVSVKKTKVQELSCWCDRATDCEFSRRGKESERDETGLFSS